MWQYVHITIVITVYLWTLVVCLKLLKIFIKGNWQRWNQFTGSCFLCCLGFTKLLPYRDRGEHTGIFLLHLFTFRSFIFILLIFSSVTNLVWMWITFFKTVRTNSAWTALLVFVIMIVVLMFTCNVNLIGLWIDSKLLILITFIDHFLHACHEGKHL